MRVRDWFQPPRQMLLVFFVVALASTAALGWLTWELLVLDREARVGKAHWGAYGVAKFALRGLLSQWADELERSTVRVHGIVPPPMRTRLRARAYFAENPGLIDTPDAAAAACVALLSAQGRQWHGRVRDLDEPV